MKNYFLTNLYFSVNDNTSKTMTCFLFHLKSSFHFGDIQVFVFTSSPLFLLVTHCFLAWSKINVKVYYVVNCLNKNLVTHFVWYLEKEKSYNIETLSTLWKNHAENMKQKQVPDPFFYFGQEKNPTLCKKFI